MTIRRHVDLATANEDYMSFEEACERAPDGTFMQAKEIRKLIGDKCDHFLAAAKFEDLKVCNGDGIREVEVLMFDMLRRQNPLSEIQQAIGLGHTLRNHPDSADRVLAGLIRDRDFLASMKTDHLLDDVLGDLPREPA